MADDALFQTFARIDLEFDRGEGCWLIERSGERYLDFASGIATNSLGHSHPHLVDAVKEQAEKLWHTSNLYQVPNQARLAERLAAVTFADRVFFANSGAEAMEGAFKCARRYHFANGAPERYRIITFEGAFHGRTLATIAAGNQAKHLEGFGPKVDGFDQVPFGDHEALKAAITSETAAILIEPVQGEGGIRVVPPQCLRGLRELADEHGILLIFDEIQTGIGRTGTFLGGERAGVEPDIATLAKGLGGGFPIGAILATNKVADAMTAGSHGTTFGGNPLACAAGNAVLDVILEESFLEHVQQMALRLKQRLAELVDSHPTVFEELRGVGLHLGLKCKIPAADVITSARHEHLLAAPAGDNVVRLIPPLIVTEAEIEAAFSRLDAAARAVEQTNAA